jgi:homoserine kinase
MPAGKSSKRIQSIKFALPATSANLGPAFDAAALAFSLFLRVEARVADKFAIRATGRESSICSSLDRNLMLTTYSEVLESCGRPVTPLSIRINNEIPIGKGCGSSAAARLAGIALAGHFGGLDLADSQIIDEASRREHHADNAAACWMGGLAIAGVSAEGRAKVACLRPKGKWPLLMVVPEDPLSTEEARRLLPDTYSRADVVSNTQNSMLLLSAFVQGRPELLKGALEDRIHQPYRATLCPLLPALQSLESDGKILGVALSGAGPSVIVFVNPDSSVASVKKLVSAELRRRGLQAELISAEIVTAGAGSFFRRRP